MVVFPWPWTAEEQQWWNHECIQKYSCTRNSGCDVGWFKCLNISSSFFTQCAAQLAPGQGPAVAAAPWALGRGQGAVPALCPCSWVLCHLQPLLQLSWRGAKILLPPAKLLLSLCAALPVIPQPVGEVGVLNFVLHVYHWLCFPTLITVLAPGETVWGLGGERCYLPPEYHVCYQGQQGCNNHSKLVHQVMTAFPILVKKKNHLLHLGAVHHYWWFLYHFCLQFLMGWEKWIQDFFYVCLVVFFFSCMKLVALFLTVAVVAMELRSEDVRVR